ncbi:MAG: alpha-amylase family glycosyl hydrolase [Rhizobacter sp.]
MASDFAAAMTHYHRQIVYQIFPERFAIGEPHDSRTKLAQAPYQRPRAVRRGWGGPVLGAGAPDPGDVFCGGVLQGVIDRLPYLAELGATTLYFTPLFEAPSNHKYDALSFDRIDPMFGDETVFRQLLDGARGQGIGVVLDAALNHVSDRHPWFLAARRGEHPYRDWFTFVDRDTGAELTTDDPAELEAASYLCWWGYRHMAELKLDAPELQDILYRRDGSVLQRFLDLGIQGWRFDTAQDIGLPFVRRMRATLHPLHPRAELLGELMNHPGDWIGEDRFTGVMNYYQRSAVLGWLSGDVGARQSNAALWDGYVGCGHAGSLSSWNMLASHDTPRLKHMLPDWTDRQLALTAQFTLPGIPVIYYGEENGMDGAGDPDCRRPMEWREAQWDRATRDFYRRLIDLRQAHPALWQGKLTVLGDRLDGTDALVYLRHTGQPGESALVVLNRSAQPFKASLLLPDPHLYSGLCLRDAMGEGKAEPLMGGQTRVEVPARSAAVFLPDDRRPDFKYFKARNRWD